jgi:hypothetical protein
MTNHDSAAGLPQDNHKKSGATGTDAKALIGRQNRPESGKGGFGHL